MVAPSGRENDDNSEDTPNSSFVTEVVIGREPLLLVVLAAPRWIMLFWIYSLAVLIMALSSNGLLAA